MIRLFAPPQEVGREWFTLNVTIIVPYIQAQYTTTTHVTSGSKPKIFNHAHRYDNNTVNISHSTLVPLNLSIQYTGRCLHITNILNFPINLQAIIESIAIYVNASPPFLAIYARKLTMRLTTNPRKYTSSTNPHRLFFINFVHSTQLSLNTSTCTVHSDTH